jgi:hypothetical protein
MNATENIPQAHDEAIAEQYHLLDRAQMRRTSDQQHAAGMAGFRAGYKGRRFTHFLSDGSEATHKEAVAALREMPQDERVISYGKTPDQMLEQLVESAQAIGEIVAKIKEMERVYTGWSRFFLVTSSSGHIHSSMHCSTCRPTTTFGWMPQLSGKTEAEAVETCGPTLCSVCFPEAPLDWQSGKKITKAQAAKMVA